MGSVVASAAVALAAAAVLYGAFAAANALLGLTGSIPPLAPIVPMLGEATERVELNKFSRTIPKRETVCKNVGDKYKEYIYVWVK